MIRDGQAIGTSRAVGTSSQWTVAASAVMLTAMAVADYRFFLFFVLAGLAVFAFVKFDIFVYALVLLAPWYPLLEFDPPFRDVSLLAHFILLVGVAVERHRRGKTFSDWFLGSRLKKAVLVFAAACAISLAFSNLPSGTDSYRALVRLFSYLMVFFAISGWLETRQQMVKIIKLLLVSTIGVALFGVYQAIEGSYTDLYFYLYPIQEDALPPWTGRITSLLFHFNSLAGYLNLVLPFAIACMVMAKDRWLRILAFVCQVVGSAALYLTGSRGGAIAYGAMLFVSFWNFAPKRAALVKIVTSLVLAGSLVLSLQTRSDGGGRLQEVDDVTQESRLALWGVAVAMFVEHPVLGVGYGGYRLLYNKYLGSDGPNNLDAHNLYLQLLADTGVVGFLIFGILMAAFSRIVVKLARDRDRFIRMVGIASAGALLTTLIHGMVDYLFNTSPQFGGLFWLVMALATATYYQRPNMAGPFAPDEGPPRMGNEISLPDVNRTLAVTSRTE